ncbi:MAG: hypothetical protein ACXWCS_06250 [Burkholderiales bacterium]
MIKWRFFQGLRGEWHWYQFGKTGEVISSSDLSFSELSACMANAERAGFDRSGYQVHARPAVAAREQRGLAYVMSPSKVPLQVRVECPVVGHEVTVSRDRVFLDYLLLSESTPTCSNIHVCLSRHGDIKNIPQCLLHKPPPFYTPEDSAA